MPLTIFLLLIVILLLFIAIYFLYRLTLPKDNETMKDLVTQLDRRLTQLDNTIRAEMARFREESTRNARDTRDETRASLKFFSDILSRTIADTGKLQAEQLGVIRQTVETRIRSLQEENTRKLEEMRATVDEKLQTTLERRLSESFQQVSERLEQVYKGLGEMQVLAVGVGDLKKMLSNVKTRGILGEIQLGNILEQLLTADQYVREVVTRKDSRERVEFAIRLPGKDESGTPVLLPVDAKFPLDCYTALLEAYDQGDATLIATRSRELEATIRKCARDIREKYIEPPTTTDFAIMFLPVEGLFAEIVRRTNLLETLQRDYKIVVTGPTTLAAILNSLQMGFRTLAIEKRSGEVWKVLSTVKTEFGKFGDVLKKAQEKIAKAGEDIDELVGTRTRRIQQSLKQVQELPVGEQPLLPGSDVPDEQP